MYDKKVLHLLDKIIESVEVILERTETVDSVNAFLDSSTGTLLLDGVCMKLIAVGESIKNLDKLTTGGLLVHYPQISWREVMGMRDIIVHHYFEYSKRKYTSIAGNIETDTKRNLIIIRRESWLDTLLKIFYHL